MPSWPCPGSAFAPCHGGSGFDNELGDLIVAVGDQIVSPGGKPFEVLKHLGRGTFGQVLKVQSGGNKVYAVKVIRNRPAFLKQAEMEVEVLQQLRVPRSKDADGKDAKEQAADPRALVAARGRKDRSHPYTTARRPQTWRVAFLDWAIFR